MSQSRSARFRELLRKPPFVCLGAHDAVTAKLAEQAGAPAIYVSGFVASAIVAGQPDFGVLTQTEMFEHTRRICRATTVPVFADADPQGMAARSMRSARSSCGRRPAPPCCTWKTSSCRRSAGTSPARG